MLYGSELVKGAKYQKAKVQPGQEKSARKEAHLAIERRVYYRPMQDP